MNEWYIILVFEKGFEIEIFSKLHAIVHCPHVARIICFASAEVKFHACRHAYMQTASTLYFA